MNPEFLDPLLKEALHQYFKGKEGETPPNLAESIRYSLLAPGKRIRPRLMISCAQMVGLEERCVMRAALALEMVHCFTLIHDDLPCMDNDDFRRGRPSNHKKFGEGIALLAGDALITLAMDVFLDSPLESSRVLAGLRRLVGATGPRGVIGGQASESLLTQNSALKDLRQMHAQKTGALFEAALLIPKDFAGIGDESPEGKSISLFSQTLGLAFQAADDLEDSFDLGPTSILHHLSPTEVARQTLEQIELATQLLFGQWGEKAKGLIQIAEEVAQKIRLRE